MALLANRIAASRGKLPGIDKACVVHRFAVTSRALNPSDDLLVAIERAWLQTRSRGMAEQAFGRDGASEIRVGIGFVSGREIPGPAVGVVSNWRLVQVALVQVAETAAHAART